MEQLDHLIEIFVQIVLVKYKYGLEGWSDVRSKKGMVGNADFDNGQSPTWELSQTHGGYAKMHGESRAEGRGEARTWSCAPARSRTLSVLNLRPSER